MITYGFMTLRPAKHEKAARTGRISNVFRIAGAHSAEQFVVSFIVFSRVKVL